MKRLSLLAAVAVLAVATPVLAESPFWPVQAKGGAVATELRGAWKSRGYGWIVQFGSDGSQLFHTAGEACYPDPRQQSDPDEILKVWRSEGQGTITLAGDASGARYLFDRLPNLPTACIGAAAWTPDRIVAFAADTFAELYPRSAERGLDWKARKTAALAQVGPTATDFQLWSALSGLIAGLDDPHVELHGMVDGAQRDLEPGASPTLTRVTAADPTGGEKVWLQAYREGILTQILAGRGRQAANNRVFWGRAEDIGYLNFMTMGGFARNAAPDDPRPLDAVLDEAMAAFAGARAVIVDVSNNRGGYDTISQAVASRFADQSVLAYSKIGVGAKAPLQPVRVEPASGERFTGPVYLVTSDVTVSAGETFTLMMKALPNVKQVGGTTHGAFSDQLPKPLPNGWALALPAELYKGPKGEDLEGRGLAPDVPLAVFPDGDLAGGHAKAILELMKEIRAGAVPAVGTAGR
ncbi:MULTISPECIES: S41 family peptidase [unclassified Caulobacter]|uniref:S41 family peptidase n=1 Tax=unclassified Caulobacter TaxID=2648921 RepID=UPI0006F9DB09|nr:MULTISPECIES: S41 family peptidase [unclassified Caulobacter]KQV58217.1 peptidase [Caulobacter sp. Root342]KQV69278.1 peptidase [Caulobacter sp. Root343]